MSVNILLFVINTVIIVCHFSYFLSSANAMEVISFMLIVQGVPMKTVP